MGALVLPPRRGRKDLFSAGPSRCRRPIALLLYSVTRVHRLRVAWQRLSAPPWHRMFTPPPNAWEAIVHCPTTGWARGVTPRGRWWRRRGRRRPTSDGSGRRAQGREERVRGADDAVLDGRARVVDATGRDATAAFLDGARRSLAIAHAASASEAGLTERSPSCGCSATHVGGSVVSFQGVAAALLARKGLRTLGIGPLRPPPA